MTLNLSDFATELLQCVFSFCSPGDLASLSRVNSTFQHAAEYPLYRHIYLSVDSSYCDRSITRVSYYAHWLLFQTLTSNPQKAALLRSFHFQLDTNSRYDETAGRITNALRGAHGLVDLRITFSGAAAEERLDVTIKSGHFQLHTLYSNCCWDLEGIIVRQKHLRLFGIDDRHKALYFGYLERIKNLCHSRLDSKRELPDIFMFRNPDISQLTLFPKLCRPGQAFTLCRDIATSLRRDLCKGYYIRSDCNFTIYIFDFAQAEAATICKMIEGMAQYFVGCQDFTMRVQTSLAVQGKVLTPWRIPGFSTSTSQLRQLRRLGFYLPSNGPLLQTTMDLRSFLLEELALACPTLKEVVVHNNSEKAYLRLY
ncbi:hypothetical protein M378DRAFT_9582 [Amanita muscaria Koide BX008]|uniref:F-box domain-containing protein n=1 Tax=Amanita muscaria (strain Koide BX008) TaxID=946122 RepID=A0A0C2XD37_AMAMK|nr:hypothetical protein M378DRAFT_9582 [Amanita muscaria Koide BX008]